MCCFVLLWGLIFHVQGRTYVAGVWAHCGNENVWIQLEGGENYIMKGFMIGSLCQILLGLSIQYIKMGMISSVHGTDWEMCTNFDSEDTILKTWN
jgi:hypothetical protein